MVDRALDEWEGRAVETWRDAWAVPALHAFAAVGSTNDVARELAERGAEEGTTVMADQQTRGRGRRGRVWRSEPGRSLLLSMVVRPRAVGEEPILSLRLGLAAARAVEDVAEQAVGMKWPNDLLVDGRKVGGMLCEGAVERDRPVYVVAGLGINVLEPAAGWPDALARRATSLAAGSAPAPERSRLAGRVIARWLDVLDAPDRTLTNDELDAFADRDVLAGRNVTLDGRPVGVCRGIAPDGALRVADADGAVHRVVAGTVRPMDTAAGERP